MGKICEYIAHLDLDGRKRKPFKCMINDDNILLPFRLNLKFPVHFSPLFRLKYSNKGNLTIAGFSEPEQCDSEDLSPWLPYPPDTDSNLDLETCLYILSRVGPQFCQLVQQEQQAKTWCPTPGQLFKKKKKSSNYYE